MFKDRKREVGSTGGHSDVLDMEEQAEKISKNGAKIGNRKVFLSRPPSLNVLGFDLNTEERRQFRNITKLLGGLASELDSFMIALMARQVVKISNSKTKAYRSDVAVFLALSRDLGMTPISRMKMIRSGINNKLFDTDEGGDGEFDEI